MNPKTKPLIAILALGFNVAAAQTTLLVRIGGLPSPSQQLTLYSAIGDRLGRAAKGEVSRLAPELAATLVSDGTLQGFSPEGEAVIQSSLPATDSRRTQQALVLIPGVVAVKPAQSSGATPLGLIVEYVEKLPAASDIQRQLDRSVSEINARHRFIVLKAGPTSARVLKQLLADPNVRYIEENYPFRMLDVVSSLDCTDSSQPETAPPDDPQFLRGYCWGLNDIGAPAAWTVIHDSSAKVGIMDTGILAEHEDLAANVSAGIAYLDTGEISTTDTFGHGSHCAGIVGAVGGNHLGVVGVCWKVNLVPIRVATGQDDYANETNLVKAVDWANDNGVRIVNMSFGGPYFPDALRAAMQEASGILFVCSAGNGDTMHRGLDLGIFSNKVYPACLTERMPNVLVVAATTREGHLWPSSNFGSQDVDFGAPGVMIRSTLPADKTGRIYGCLSGTSEAAPFVAGAAALMLGAPAYQNASPEELKTTLASHLTATDDLKLKAKNAGRLNIAFLKP